jgi:hypothetical protein
MISAWWLLLIIPVVFACGTIVGGSLACASNADDRAGVPQG